MGWQGHESEYPEIFEAQVEWRSKLLKYAFHPTRRRTVVLSRQGYLCLGSKVLRAGDYIFILFALQEPAILRKHKDGLHAFVGTAYVHGIMKGELLEVAKKSVSQGLDVPIRFGG